MVELSTPYFTSDDKNIVVRFDYDDFPDSPREWASTTFVTWLRNHCSPDKNSYGDPNELLDELRSGDYYWSKVYATIHSGISYFRAGSGIYDQWDSGFAGFIFIKKEAAKRYFNLESEDDIYRIFDKEIEYYTKYSNGGCYCCHIDYLDDDTCDCHGGYYDLDECVKSMGYELGFSENDLIEAKVKKIYV